jgi:pimeloyl-ACP methyl ester carboxylesterase
VEKFLAESGKWIVYMDDHGRRNALESWGPAAQLSHLSERDADVPHPAVLVPDLPGWGDSLPALVPYTLVGWGSVDRFAAYLSCALGDGVLAIQTRCAANLIAYLIREKKVDPGDLILVGRGLGGVVALLSGALCEGIGGIVSWESLGSFQSLAEEENTTWPSTAFLPDVLRVFDLPEIVHALEPCPVLMLNPLDAGQRSLSVSEARSLFSPIGDTVRIVPECEPADALRLIWNAMRGES